MTTKPLTKHRNGVDVGAILAARNVLTENPEAAQFQGRAQGALRSPTAEHDAYDWYEMLRDSLSNRLFDQAQAIAVFQWTSAEASWRMS